MAIYRLNYIYDIVIPMNEIVLTINNGCTQIIININSFLIQSFTVIHFTVEGVLNSMGSSKLELFSESYTLVILSKSIMSIFKINQSFLDNGCGQTEAPLQPYQVRSFGVR